MWAQTSDSLGVAYRFAIVGQNIQPGSVVSHYNAQYLLSSEAYDKNVFGVVTPEPAIEFSSEDTAGTYAIVRSGTVPVRVSAKNGAIANGDLIVASEQPGVAMKAAKSGFSLGIARESFAPSNPEEIGLIPVSLDIKFTFASDSPSSEKIGARLLDVVNFSAIAAINDPTEVFRRVAAAVVMLIPMALSIFTIVRSAQKGVVALGRNPLAKTAILGGIIFNSLMSLVFVAAGIAGAYVILIV